MSEICKFSFEEAPSPPLKRNMTYAAQCPLCGAIRTSELRFGPRRRTKPYRVFPRHGPLDAAPRERARWKRDATGTWYWHWWMPPQKGGSK